MKIYRKKLKGFSLAELVLAVGIFSMIASSLTILVIDSTRSLQNSRSRAEASYFIQEVRNALVSIKSDSWYNLAQYTGTGPKHLTFENYKYSIVEGSGEYNNFTYEFSVHDALRDLNHDLVFSGGIIDPHSRLIRISITWEDTLGKSHTLNPEIYINDWSTNSLVYTTESDFTPGDHSGTVTANVEGGELHLEELFYPDWCNPELSFASYDLPQQGVAKSISNYGDIVYIGTGENASGLSFIEVTVDDSNPPIVTVGDTFDGYKVNDIFGIENHAYLATDTNAKEVVILDLDNTPISEIGYFDSAGPENANTIFVYENKGFVGHGNTLSIFDLTSKTGSRNLLTSVEIGVSTAIITDLFVDEQYIYMTLSGADHEFVIYEYDPDVIKVAFSDLGPINSTSLFISEDTQHAYIAASQSVHDEFFIINTSIKSGSLPMVSSTNIDNLSIKGLANIDERTILVGSGGQEYLVLDTSDETSPVICGGKDVNTGINAIALSKQGYKFYSYILTGDANDEFKIIEGGSGGGGDNGYGYVSSGTYTSEIFNSTNLSSQYYVLDLKADIPLDTSLNITFRASNDPSMTGISWIGPDGTSDTSYIVSGIYDLPDNLMGQYFQYRAIFESNTIVTPILKEIVINYEK